MAAPLTPAEMMQQRQRPAARFGLLVAAGVALGVSAGACGSSDCDGVAPQTLDSVYSKFFREGALTGCTLSGCHRSGTRTVNDGLEFTTAREFWQHTVNVPAAQRPELSYVKPGEPSESYLFLKLQPGAPPRRMPDGGPYLTPSQLEEVKGWICAGAPEPSP